MKNKVLSIAVLAFCGMACLGSCSDDWSSDQAASTQGTLNTASIRPTVDAVETSQDESASLKAPASRAVTDLSNYIVEVVGQDNAVVSSWTYATMPEAPTFAPATYTARVRSHEVQGAEWDKPYYVGEQEFQIQANKVTDVSPIVCKLGNVRVSLMFTDALLKAANGGDDIRVVVTSSPGVSLDYTVKDAFTEQKPRSGYFAVTPDLTTLKVKFEGTVSNVKESFTRVLTDVQAGQHRKVTFALRVNPNPPVGEHGQIVIPDGEGINVDCGTETVDVDGKVIDKEDVQDDSDRPGKEDPDPTDPDDPTPPTPGDETAIVFTSDYLDLEGPNDAAAFGADKPAKVHIHSDNGFANLKVKIISNYLTEEMLNSAGFTSQFDLAYPGGYKAALDGLGFKTGDQVIGANDLDFDITPFLALISEQGDHNFEITVVDQKAITKQMTLIIRVN